MEKRKENNKRKLALILLLLGALVLLSINLGSSYKLYCLTDGQVLPPNSDNPRYVCNSDQCINICTTDSGFPGVNPASCNGIGTCQTLGGGSTELDITPPTLNVNSPANNEVYGSSGVLFNLNFDEPSSVYYKDNNDERRGFKRICSNCASSYLGNIRLSDGQNNITIRVEDSRGNPTEQTFVFYVDSKEPRIRGTEPRRDFASGDFSVEFDEDNPKELVLHYGVNSDMRSANVDLENKCYLERRSRNCEISVDLSDFDNSNIEYYFEIEDIAGNKDMSDSEELRVDYSKPVINNLEFYFDERSNYLRLNFTESNVDEITYIDLNDPRGRERSLCRRAENGVCEEKVRLDDGHHELRVRVFDEAGNMAEETITFISDLDEPKIKKTEPRRGYASGDFFVEFDEENPKELKLHYGVEGDMRISNVEIDSSCQMGRRSMECNVLGVDLSDFNEQEIKYYFSLNDIYDKVDVSRENELEVDTVFPVLNNPDSYWVQGTGRESNEIFFNFDITEQNFEEVLYSYTDERGRLRERTICSRLDKEDRDDVRGLCNEDERFREGSYELNIQIIDEAGNSIGFPISFTIEDN